MVPFQCEGYYFSWWKLFLNYYKKKCVSENYVVMTEK